MKPGQGRGSLLALTGLPLATPVTPFAGRPAQTDSIFNWEGSALKAIDELTTKGKP